MILARALRFGPRRPATVAVALLLAAAPIALAAPETGPGPEATTARAVGASSLAPDRQQRVRDLLGRLTAASPDSSEEVARSLAALGPEVAADLLALRNEYADGPQVRAIAETLSRLHDERLEPYLLSVVEWSESMSAQAAAFEALAEHGGPAAVPHLVRTMSRNQPRLKSRAEGALAAVLRRNATPELYATVARLLPEAPLETRARVVSAVAAAGSAEGLGLLGDLLGRDPDLELAVVTALGRLAGSGDGSEIIPRLRLLLQSTDPDIRREAVSALARFGDVESVDTMIELLGDDQRGVQGNAHWALRTRGGLDLPPDPERWRLWLAEERDWWEAEGERCLAWLDSDREEEVLEALFQISRRRLFRDRFADRVAALAESDNERIRAASRAVLGLESAGTDGGGGGRLVSVRATPSRLEGLPAPPPAAVSTGRPAPAATDDRGSNGWVGLAGGLLVLGLLLRVLGVLSLDRVRGWLGRG